ncbi:MAG: hypothetical protein ACR2PS_03900 [Pseudomonadales bacterium]
MKNRIGPTWSEKQIAAGQRMRDTWMQYASASQTTDKSSRRQLLSHEETSKLDSVRIRHEAELMRYPNAIGVAIGIRTKQGKPTGEHCIVVYVSQKIPPNQLNEDEILPSHVEGVPVDVVGVGQVEALSL